MESEERSYTPEASRSPTPPPAQSSTQPGPNKQAKSGWTKTSNLDRLMALIEREPDARMDFECSEFVSFLKKYIEWFNGIKPEFIKDIVKNCKFMRVPQDTVVIKQGDVGDSMFAVLEGTLTVHVFFDPDNDKECLNKVEQAMAKKKFNKNDFGNEVAKKVAGSCIGEVALVAEENKRTATCIAATECSFIVIDRDLYRVTVKEFIEREFREKTFFVESNALFKYWTPRQRDQLVISLKKIKIGFQERLVKQGNPIDGIYFVFKGAVDIYIDPHQYKNQFPVQHTELKGLLPEMVHESKPTYQAPSKLRKERMAGHRAQQLCSLGVNESIGSLEVILGLESYIETAISPGECELVMLKKTQFERMFRRKYALQTVDKLRESLGTKLCLYIYQSDPASTAFLKYLNMKLMDHGTLQEVKKSKLARARQGANIGQVEDTRTVEEQDIANVLKRLHMSTEIAAQLPPEDKSELALAKMDRRLRLWSEKTNMNGRKIETLQSSSITLSATSNIG